MERYLLGFCTWYTYHVQVHKTSKTIFSLWLSVAVKILVTKWYLSGRIRIWYWFNLFCWPGCTGLIFDWCFILRHKRISPYLLGVHLLGLMCCRCKKVSMVHACWLVRCQMLLSNKPDHMHVVFIYKHCCKFDFTELNHAVENQWLLWKISQSNKRHHNCHLLTVADKKAFVCPRLVWGGLSSDNKWSCLVISQM